MIRGLPGGRADWKELPLSKGNGKSVEDVALWGRHQLIFQPVGIRIQGGAMFG